MSSKLGRDSLGVSSFIALAIDHPLSKKYEKSTEFNDFKEQCYKIGNTDEAIAKTDKYGFKTDYQADHPFIKNKKIPVYFANFVLIEYGTGAIFGCPAHDQRDLDFARKYNLDVVPVILPPNKDEKSYIYTISLPENCGYDTDEVSDIVICSEDVI